MDFLSLCIMLNPRKEGHCLSIFGQLDQFFDYFLSLNNLIILSVLLILIVNLIFLNNERGKFHSYFIYFLILFIYLSIVSKYPVNFPWVDDWQWFENIYLKQNSYSNWLFERQGSHFLVIPKLIFYLTIKFFNSNFYLISIATVFLIFLSSLIVITKESRLSNLHKVIIILIITSPKIFPNISQFCNIAWYLSFFLIILFNYSFKNTSTYLVLMNVIIILISPFTFGLSLVIPIFNIFFIVFINISLNKKIIYFSSSLISILVFTILSILLSKTSNDPKLSINIFQYIDFNTIIIFFGSLANLFIPWSEYFIYIAFLIGVLQTISIVLILSNNVKKIGFNNALKNFLNENFLILSGILFALLISFTRNDPQSVVAARYSVGSIVFQIGYFIFIFKNTKLKFIHNNLIKAILITHYLISFLLPYQGFHWQIDRYIKSIEIINCYKSNSKSLCNEKAYNVVFYNSNWYSFENFEKIIDIMISDNTKVFKQF